MIGIVIQARMGSTRLPGKVLKTINGLSLLEIQIQRVKHSKHAQKIIVATSDQKLDDQIAQFCQDHGVEFYRGSENDVLDRYYSCAKHYQLTCIVRLTADCPMSDSKVIDACIEQFQRQKLDYLANTVPPQTATFPDGFDVEVFSLEALEKAHTEVTDAKFREHVTFYFWQTDKFKVGQYRTVENFSEYRVTVDYPEDLLVLEKIMQNFKANYETVSMEQVISFLKNNNEVKKLNNQYTFGMGWK